MGFKLVDRDTGAQILPGDTVTTFRGQIGVLQDFTPPRHTTSSGRVLVNLGGTFATEWFPSVIGAEIVPV